MIPFTDAQRQTLRDLSDVREGNMYSSVNQRLEAYIIALRDQYPEMFLGTQNDLKERVFVDTPSTIPPSLYKRAVLTLANSSRKVLG
jgi:transposase-like protein